jgi:putative transposase
VSFSNSEPGRKHLPHLSALEFPNQTILQYVTVCVHKRRPLLARPETVNLLQDCWRKADHWLVGRWVVMPDHLHLFCAPAKFPRTPLKQWMQFWRNESTRRWPFPGEKPIWQRDFFDRQLRSGESYHQKWLYIWENPIKKDFVRKPEDWPFQGELNVIPWHEAG